MDNPIMIFRKAKRWLNKNVGIPVLKTVAKAAKKVLSPVGKAISDKYSEWTPKTRGGWFLKNIIDKTVGPGAKEALQLENLKITITNMASKIIGMLHDSLNGKQAIANEKKAAKKAERGTVSPNKAKASIKDASINVKAPGMAAGKAAGKAAKPILSTDIGATIAQATVAASGKSSQALISGKGLEAKSMDLGR